MGAGFHREGAQEGLLNRDNHGFVAAFWCCEDAAYNIRWLRLVISPSSGYRTAGFPDAC
jgi:hypothetical protein